MSAEPHSRPFAWGPGIFIGIVILWAGSLGLFWLGSALWRAYFPGEDLGA